MSKNTAINTAATSERELTEAELTDSELDAVSGGLDAIKPYGGYHPIYPPTPDDDMVAFGRAAAQAQTR